MVSVAVLTPGCTELFFVELGMKVDGKYTWTTTVTSCRRSRCCQSCVALLATRLCSGKPPRSWNSPASSANTTFYICSSVAAKQSGPKTSWIPNLGTDAENCRNVCIEYTASRHQRLEAAPHWHMGKYGLSQNGDRRSCWSMEKALMCMRAGET